MGGEGEGRTAAFAYTSSGVGARTLLGSFGARTTSSSSCAACRGDSSTIRQSARPRCVAQTTQTPEAYLLNRACPTLVERGQDVDNRVAAEPP